MKSDPDSLALLVEKVKVWLIRSRFKKAQYGAWSVIKCKCLPAPASLYQCLPVSASLFRWLPVAASVCQSLPVATGVYWCVPVSTSGYRCLLVSSSVWRYIIQCDVLPSAMYYPVRKKIEWRREMLVKIQGSVRKWIAVKKYRHR